MINHKTIYIITKTLGRKTEQPIHTPDDREFTREKVRQVIEGLKQKKSPGPNGITNNIVKLIFKVIPKTIISL